MGKTIDTQALKREITESYDEKFEIAQKSFKNMNLIGIPKDREQLELFNKYLKIYEQCMREIEDRMVTLKSYGNEDYFNERQNAIRK